MKRVKYQLNCFVIFMLLMAASCKKENVQPAGTNLDQSLAPTGMRPAPGKGGDYEITYYYGPSIVMGKGIIKSWISINHAGIPLELGVEFSDDALSSLPEEPGDLPFILCMVPLPRIATVLTPFNHISVNWNAQSANPIQMKDIPHLDFCFYTITMAEHLAIPDYHLAAAAFDSLPAVNLRPPMYQPLAAGVALTGKLWEDEQFTLPYSHSMFYGSFNGKFVFVAPFIAKTLLSDGSSFSADYRQPDVFIPGDKFYPGQYNVYKDPFRNNHFVTLSNFSWR